MNQKLTWFIGFLMDPKIAEAFQKWLEEDHFNYLFEMGYFKKDYLKTIDTRADGWISISYVLYPKSERAFEEYEKNHRLEARRRFTQKFELAIKKGQLVSVLATGTPEKRSLGNKQEA